MSIDTTIEEQCPEHPGPLVERDPKAMTIERRWCGRWFGCAMPDCLRVSVLLPSAELLAANAAFAAYPPTE